MSQNVMCASVCGAKEEFGYVNVCFGKWKLWLIIINVNLEDQFAISN